jgi:ornithine decarboxylase
MNHVRVRTAVSPLRRRFPGAATPMPSVDELIAMERPEEPMHCLRPATVEAAARAFAEVFPGDLLYAVKANPEPAMLRAVHAGGVTHFDCASIGEIALVRQMFSDASIHFMHPVKSRGAIREAWQRHGVRDFVLDSAEELAKILHETAATCVAGELGLIVRLALPKGPAVLDLSGKFGAEPAPAADLLRAARPHAARLGLSFHVGSQCPEPLAWRRALALVGEVISDAGVAIEVIDVGGGFPVRYPDVEVPPLGVTSLKSRQASSASAGRRRGCGPSPAALLSPVAHRWSCRCSIGAAMRCTSATAFTVRWRMPVRSAFAIRYG